MPEVSSDAAQRPTTIPWPPILLAVAIPGAWGLGRVHPLNWPGLDDGPARALGWGFGIVGAGLIVWALVAFRRARTTVMPHQRVSHLITDGPFRFRRNPIYLGEVFLFLFAAELTKNVWFVVAGFAFAVAVTWLAILPEERHLEARFGDQWRAYRDKTRRWI